jgi:quercetin dioxygenase-like cupin family protein
MMRVKAWRELESSISGEASGVTIRYIRRTEDVELKVLEIEPGSSTPYHAHEHPHDSVVISGHGAVRQDPGAHEFGPGDIIQIAANELHAIVNRADELLQILCMDCLI